MNPEASVSQSALRKEDSQPIPAPQQQSQQVSPPQPLHAPRDYHADEAALPEEKLSNDVNEPVGNIRFVQKNGKIVPDGPSDANEIDKQRESLREANDFQQQKQQKNVVERPNVASVPPLGNEDGNKNSPDEGQRKQVMSPPSQDDAARDNIDIPAVDLQAEEPLAPSVEKASKTAASDRPISIQNARAEDDELQALQERVDGILNHNA